jgi:hypothetical protein
MASGDVAQVWHNPRMRGSKVDRKVTFMTTPEMIEAVDRWRAQQRPLPSRNAALRTLIERALTAAGEPIEETRGGQGVRPRRR